MLGSRFLFCGPVWFALCCALLSMVSAGAGGPGDKQELERDRVGELRREKLALLERAYEQAQQRYAEGTVAMRDVLKVQNRVLKAKWHLAETEQERIAILRERVEAMKALEKIVTVEFRAGRSGADTLAVTNAGVRRINAEIALAKALAATDETE